MWQPASATASSSPPDPCSWCPHGFHLRSAFSPWLHSVPDPTVGQVASMWGSFPAPPTAGGGCPRLGLVGGRLTLTRRALRGWSCGVGRHCSLLGVRLFSVALRIRPQLAVRALHLSGSDQRPSLLVLPLTETEWEEPLRTPRPISPQQQGASEPPLGICLNLLTPQTKPGWGEGAEKSPMTT